MDKVFNGYTSQDSPMGTMGTVNLAAGKKLYFEIDPVAVTGGPVSAFSARMIFFSGGNIVCKLTQDKSTGAYSSEVCRQFEGYLDVVWNPSANTKFLYAIDNRNSGDANDGIWAVIPFVP